MKRLFSLAACWVATAAFAQGDPAAAAESKKNEATFQPLVIDSKDGSGMTLALEYKLLGVLYQTSNDKPGPIDAPIEIRDIQLRYKLTGTVASSSAKNPKNFLEFLLEGAYLQKLPYGTASAGLMAKYETDQSLDNKQSVLGLRGTWGKYAFLGSNDFVALDASYGRVTPTGDSERKAVLGNEDPFNRWNAEFLYMFPLNHAGPLRVVEFNYRYFRETSPPAGVVAAGLDRHRLSTIRFGLPKDFFIGYTSGKLPFDRKSDKALEIGWSYKLE